MQDVVGRSMRKIKNLQKANAAQITYAELFIDDSFNLEYLVYHSLLILQDANKFRTGINCSTLQR